MTVNANISKVTSVLLW